MSRSARDLEERCFRLLRRHLEAGDERTLSEAYEFGRAALAEGVGVLDLALVLGRAILAAFRTRSGVDDRLAQRAESFLLECLSPFEMAQRGAREASEAVRRFDQRREEQVRRIARELHDEAGQLLATVYLALDRLHPHLAPEGDEPLAQAKDLLRQVEDELRRVAHELRPTILDDLGLLPALRFLGEGVTQRSGILVRVVGSTEDRLPPAVEIALYRAAQEALSNVARHAGASRATIELQRMEREVVCRIQDDGCGFDTERVFARGERPGLGLAGLRERMAMLGGALQVSSQPGRGTELVMHIPLEVSHGDAGVDCR